MNAHATTGGSYKDPQGQKKPEAKDQSNDMLKQICELIGDAVSKNDGPTTTMSEIDADGLEKNFLDEDIFLDSILDEFGEVESEQDIDDLIAKQHKKLKEQMVQVQFHRTSKEHVKGLFVIEELLYLMQKNMHVREFFIKNNLAQTQFMEALKDQLRTIKSANDNALHTQLQQATTEHLNKQQAMMIA